MEVRDYISLADNLRTERAAFEGGWDEMRRLIMPRATAVSYTHLLAAAVAELAALVAEFAASVAAVLMRPSA